MADRGWFEEADGRKKHGRRTPRRNHTWPTSQNHTSLPRGVVSFNAFSSSSKYTTLCWTIKHQATRGFGDDPQDEVGEEELPMDEEVVSEDEAGADGDGRGRAYK